MIKSRFSVWGHTILLLVIGSILQGCSNKGSPEPMKNRVSQYHVDNLILTRWSARAMSGKKISHEQLMKLFEAASFAPSSGNSQPWRFIYAMRETPAWDTFFNLLVPGNQRWAENAAVLIVVVSRNTAEHNNKPLRTHSFDTGAACENMALQAHRDGLVAHGMGGFDLDAARKQLNIPQDYTIEAMFAIGYPGNIEELPTDLQQREMPGERKPVEQVVSEGSFSFKN